MRILFLTSGLEIPSSRYRVRQFLPHFEKLGLSCTVRHAYGTGYNRFHSRRWAPAYKLACRLKRVFHTVTAEGFDLVFLQRSALPMSALPERLLARRGAKLVFDFDDAIFLGANGAPSFFRERTFHQVVGASDRVIAGTRHLARCARSPDKTRIIPTVVDTELYVPPARRNLERPVVGWMGTASNFASVRPVLPEVLSAVESHPHAVLRLVSNASLPGLEGHPRVEQVRWSAQEELRQLQSFDVGLMPLTDTASNRGKCGFKMLQYMAVGASVVASAVGVNSEIFEGSGSGRLLEPGAPWGKAVAELLAAPELRSQMGQAGRAHVESRYSVASVLERYLELFGELA